MKIAFLGGLLMLLANLASAATDDLPTTLLNVPPPTLLTCASKSDCSHDSAAFQAFIDGFYHWYIDSRTDMITARMGTPEPESTEIMNRWSDDQDRILKQLFSTHLFRAYLRSLPLMDGRKPAPLCYDTNDDPITCRWQPFYKFTGPIIVDVDSLTERAATLSVSFPAVLAESNSLGMRPPPVTLSPYKLSIGMKAEHGYWKIDRIEEKS